MTQERLELVELGLSIHVGQEPLIVAETANPIIFDNPPSRVVEQISNVKALFIQPAHDWNAAGRIVRRAQAMIAAFGLPDDTIRLGARFEPIRHRSSILPPG